MIGFNSEEWPRKWAKIVARAWAEEAFKERLREEPERVLTEEGIEVPKNVKIEVVEGDLVFQLWIPPKPEGVAEWELAEHATETVSLLTRDCEQSGLTPDLTRAKPTPLLTRILTGDCTAALTRSSAAPELTRIDCFHLTRDCEK